MLCVNTNSYNHKVKTAQLKKQAEHIKTKLKLMK